MRGDREKFTIFYTLKDMRVNFKQEHQFHPVRKFRFDFVIPSHKIAIEYEGIISGKSRHTTIGGYTRDTEKYNLATICGWRVLRYTAKNISSLRADLVQLMNHNSI